MIRNILEYNAITKDLLLYMLFENFKKSAEQLKNDKLLLLLTEVNQNQVNGISVKKLEDDLLSNFEQAKTSYSKELENKSIELNERGVLRTLTWGKKAAASQMSLLNRYNKSPSIINETNKIHVCDACGFVIVKADTPEKCPVCKAPADKFISY